MLPCDSLKGPNKVKIIHVIPNLENEASGPSYSVPRLCDELKSLGEDVSLGAFRTRDDISSANTSLDTINRTYVKEFPLGIGGRKLGRSPALYRWLLSSVGDDIVVFHNHGMWNLMSLYVSRLKYKGKTLIVQSPRNALSPISLKLGSRLKPSFWRLFQKKALSKVDLFHATCEQEYHDIRNLGYTQPVAVIPNGIDPYDLDNLCNEKQNKTRATLLFLARIHPDKNIEALLHAWSKIHGHFPNWTLRIIGPGDKSYVESLQRLAKELKLENIEFAGARMGPDKWNEYRSASLYVLPSLTENFGMTIAEALTAGTPVICTTGTPWSGITGQGCGWWINSDKDALESALRMALAMDLNDLMKMGAKGKEWVDQEFSWVNIGIKMQQTYSWLGDDLDYVPDHIRIYGKD